MATKTIKVTDANGNPIQGAHVIPDVAPPTVTNSAGEATITVDDVMQFVEITAVAGESMVYSFFDLPETVILGRNQLDPAIITVKKKSWAPWVLAGVGTMILISAIASNETGKPLKVKL